LQWRLQTADIAKRLNVQSTIVGIRRKPAESIFTGARGALRCNLKKPVRRQRAGYREPYQRIREVQDDVTGLVV